MSTSTFNTNYYDDYVTNLNIFQLGQFASRQERDDITYGVQLIDCFSKNRCSRIFCDGKYGTNNRCRFFI